MHPSTLISTICVDAKTTMAVMVYVGHTGSLGASGSVCSCSMSDIAW